LGARVDPTSGLSHLKPYLFFPRPRRENRPGNLAMKEAHIAMNSSSRLAEIGSQTLKMV
jgi:hypothetical protein